MSGRLAIIGAGGHGCVIADAALAGGWDSIVFFDDHRKGMAKRWVIKGTNADLLAEIASYDGVAVGIGDNGVRMDWCERLLALGAILPVVRHPKAVISEDCAIGPGTVIMAGAILNIGARVGRACIINTGAIVDHDVVLGDGVHISPGGLLAGQVVVRARAWVGAGATVKNGIEIGNGATIGLGSAVIRDVPDGAVVVGVPARDMEARLK